MLESLGDTRPLQQLQALRKMAMTQAKATRRQNTAKGEILVG